MMLKYEVLSILLISKSKGIPALTVQDFRILYSENIASLRMTLSHLRNTGLVSRTGGNKQYAYSITIEGVEALDHYFEKLEDKGMIGQCEPKFQEIIATFGGLHE